jgi:heme exporter protein D
MFLLSESVTVTDGAGTDFVLPEGSPVYMDHHLGDAVAKWMEGDLSVSMSEDHGAVTFIDGGHEIALNDLTLNKYVENETHITGEEAIKLWNARSSNFAFGANMHDSEYAVQQSYANFFFFITGFHGFHVFSGVIINLIVLLMAVNGVFERRKHYEMVEKVGLYWHFVDLVWVFVFTFFYLI